MIHIIWVIFGTYEILESIVWNLNVLKFLIKHYFYFHGRHRV